MKRLHHSYAGFLRLMQISATQLFVFVEGKQCDPYFFSEICSAALGSKITFSLTMAQQIPGDSGGKQALIAFFVFLRTKRALISNLGGKRTACLFFLDKDVDDIRRIRKRSLHVVYTQYYDVQNYVFQHGDLIRGSAAAASVDPRCLEADLGTASQWCLRVAALWRDWITLCLQMTKDNISCQANYRVLSPVQTRLCGPTNLAALHDLTEKIAVHSRCPVTDLKRRLKCARAKVDCYFARREHHRIFKGKWFSSILADDIDRIMAGDPYDSSGLRGRLLSTIAATLDFSEPWADYFKTPLRNIAGILR